MTRQTRAFANLNRKGFTQMETRLTTWDAALKLSQKAGITPEQVKVILQAQAELAYEHAKEGYPVAGIGIFTIGERPATVITMAFGPRQGQQVTIPAKKVLKFRIAKVAKDVVLRGRPIAPDVTTTEVVPDEDRDENAE
jgi:DNA-binding protein HU-beta